MEALRQLWRVLGIIFQGIYSLWKKYQSYRVAQKALRTQVESSQAEPSPSPTKSQQKDSQASDAPQVISSNLDATPAPQQQIEIPLIKEEEDATSTRQSKAHWYAPGHGVQIQDIFIADGLLYVGQILTIDHKEHPSAPGLINPELAIHNTAPDQRQEIVEADWFQDGQLSYDTLSPEMRCIFLGWLATGRKEREIPASALRLFLYGIEYRVIELLTGERTLDELLAIILELERLEVHYAHHQSLIPKIRELIECCQVQLALSCQPETLLALLPIGQKLSVALKVALGRCIELAKPIPMTLLWAWYQSSPVAVDLKTPAKRCESAFNFLIQTRGEQQGFTIATGENPATLPVVYEPFSPVFGESPQSLSVVNTIDIAGLEPQLTFLEPLIESCTNDLDAYSRLIGRSPEAEGTPLAVALLPQELVRLSGNDAVQTFQEWLNERVGSQEWVMVPGTELLEHWPSATPDKIRKKEAELLGQLMAKLGYGYGPDVRYGQATFNPKHSVVLFRLNVPGVDEISAQYPLASTVLELMPYLEGLADEEGEPIIQTITSHFALSLSERSRLSALQQWRKERPLSWKQTLGRMKKLSKEHQEQLAIALNTEFEKTWLLEDAKYIELQTIIPLPKRDIQEPSPPIEVQASPEVEPAQQEATEPATIATSVLENEVVGIEPSNEAPTQTIEPEPDNSVEPMTAEPEPPVFVLDRQLIAQRNQESQVASGLLNDIFTEDESQSPLPTSEGAPLRETIQAEPGTEANTEANTLSLGLDAFHWHLLNHLGQQESWDRSELEAIAQGQGLLLDGALENINDVAFDQCDEALTEGDDPIEVNDWVFDELKAA